ncbi:MAG: ribonuclease HI [Desulfamplus sp.]|nr:ribonuclease HI [Desulfamplus sp.]
MPEKNISPPDNAVTIFTDGASSGNPGPSGIGAVLIYGKHEKEISEFIGESTNNIAELSAIQRALSQLKRRDLPVRLFTDSNYAIGMLTKEWKASRNRELIVDIKKLMAEFYDLKIMKIKAHAGFDGNERADMLATGAITRESARDSLHPSP